MGCVALEYHLDRRDDIGGSLSSVRACTREDEYKRRQLPTTSFHFYFFPSTFFNTRLNVDGAVAFTGCPLLGLVGCPDRAAQKERFKETGWECSNMYGPYF